MRLEFKAEDFQGGERLEEGTSLCTITKVEDKQSQAGNPMVMITFADASGSSDTERFTITDKAMFRIARVFRAVGLTGASLDTNQLRGRKLTVTKTFKGMEAGSDNKEYRRYDYKFSPVVDGSTALAASTGEDSIPF